MTRTDDLHAAEARLAELGAAWLYAHLRRHNTATLEQRITDATRDYRRAERRLRREAKRGPPITDDNPAGSGPG